MYARCALNVLGHPSPRGSGGRLRWKPRRLQNRLQELGGLGGKEGDGQGRPSGQKGEKNSNPSDERRATSPSCEMPLARVQILSPRLISVRSGFGFKSYPIRGASTRAQPGGDLRSGMARPRRCRRSDPEWHARERTTVLTGWVHGRRARSDLPWRAGRCSRARRVFVTRGRIERHGRAPCSSRAGWVVMRGVLTRVVSRDHP
jgi:hypothetical protein